MASSKADEQKIRKLREEITRHDHLYHVEARPQISDRDYDRLMAELIELERANPELATADSPTQRVGGQVQTALKSVRHAVPMMSIDNTYSEDEVRAFDERVRKGLDGEQPAYVLEPKIDGASVSLRYEEGKLVLGATRGRGNMGDDITVNARTIKSIPLTLRKDGAKVDLPAVLEVRGEVYMDNEDFQRVNKEIVEEGEEPYANPRNLTSGTLRRLDPKIVAKRRLRFLAHGLGQVEPMTVTSYWEWTQLLRKWGLPLPKEVWKVADVDEAIKRIHEFEKSRKKLPYMTDGMVMKVDDFAQRERLGATSKSPRWVIAYKYETEQQPTILKSVDWQVGKGGNLTPVGKLEPVFIGGVTVSNVTLHNFDQIKRLDIHLGDTLIIERAGEVIPYVVEVDGSKRPKGAKPVEPPAKCPSCGEKVEKEADTPYIRCVNPACPAQLKERLRWFCHRGQMDINGLGERIIDQLVDQGRLKSYGDIFRLRVEQIEDLTHETELGEKTAAKIVEGIKAAKSRGASVDPPLGLKILHSPLELKKHIQWLAKPAQMNIKGLGEKTIEQLVDDNIVGVPSDLFDLETPTLAALPREVKVGAATAGKIVEAAEQAKSRGLSRVLGGLGIRHVGTTVARNVAEWAGSWKALNEATESELHRAVRAGSDDDDDPRGLAEVAAIVHGALKSAPPAIKSALAAAKDSDDLAESLINLAKHARVSNRIKERRAQILASAFEQGEAMIEASEQQIRDALESERVIAKSLFDFIHSKEGQRVFDDFNNLGVKLTEERAVRVVGSKVSGMIMVITGTFTRFTRDQLRERLIALGAKVTDSVTSKTNILLVGTDAGSKLDKARALGTVDIWDEVKLLHELPEILKQ